MVNKKTLVALFCVMFLVSGLVTAKDKPSTAATDKKGNETATGDASTAPTLLEQKREGKLGQEIKDIDADYLRDTGTMIYTTKKPKAGNKVINIMRTTIQRPDVTEK